MRMLVLVLAVCLTASAASMVGADTVQVSLSKLNGWSIHTKNSTVDPRAQVSERTAYGTPAANGFEFSPGKSVSGDRSCAVASLDSMNGVAISSITSLKIKTAGIEGDGSGWMPPSITLAMYASPTNLVNRCAYWIPWKNGNSRDTSGAWHTYDCFTTGTWYIPASGGIYSSWTAMLTAVPNAFISDAAGAAFNFPSGKGFNVGQLPYYNELNTYTSSARGVVDWVEIGVSGSATTYDFAEIPEPSALFALLGGLMGLSMYRRIR